MQFWNYILFLFELDRIQGFSSCIRFILFCYAHRHFTSEYQIWIWTRSFHRNFPLIRNMFSYELFTAISFKFSYFTSTSYLLSIKVFVQMFYVLHYLSLWGLKLLFIQPIFLLLCSYCFVNYNILPIAIRNLFVGFGAVASIIF